MNGGRPGPPTTPRSFKGGRGATQRRDGGRTDPGAPSPKSLTVRRVGPNVVHRLIATKHYLRSMPKAPIACFGVYLGRRLVGAAVFSVGPRNGHRAVAAGRSHDVVTLA